MVEDLVDCITLKELISRFKLKDIDVLAIDAEGADYMIFDQFNFDQFCKFGIIYLHMSIILSYILTRIGPIYDAIWSQLRSFWPSFSIFHSKNKARRELQSRTKRLIQF